MSPGKALLFPGVLETRAVSVGVKMLSIWRWTCSRDTAFARIESVLDGRVQLAF